MSDATKDLFRTRDHVADFDLYLAEYSSRSAKARARHRSALNLSYGNDATEKLDLFLPPASTAPQPIHMFIHGGYWRMFSKDDFSFIADTVVAAGGIAAIIDYALMPAVRMDTIVDQVRRAASWLVANAARYGGDPTRFTISGHSAGAHLCCSLMDTGSPVTPQKALLLSGIYDLAPLQSSFLQPLIALTDAEVRSFSPLKASFRAPADIQLLLGSAETAPFHQQAQQLAQNLRGMELGAEVITLAGGNHMSVVQDLGDPATEAGSRLIALIQH
ncbi:MAG: esterase/lipase [Devosia sp.]|nr:esterase/lipase [Devosia sp.]